MPAAPVIEYSKPATDVAGHTARMLKENDALLARQRAIAATLLDRPARSQCLVCAAVLAGAPSFVHRGIPYVLCRSCRHVQCAVDAPAGYPQGQQDFADVYIPLDPAAYRERSDRIYKPKLDWALRAAKTAALANLLERSWVELGSGAGHFVDVLHRAGAKNVLGLEAEEALVDRSVHVPDERRVRRYGGSLADAIRQHPAEIYAAWFVLEHCFELREVMAALDERPRGTVLLLSVPMLGLATLLEVIGDAHFARQLDSVVHLQLFTENSLARLLDLAGFEQRAAWVFGQDADDLLRMIAVGLAAKGNRPIFGPEIDRLLAACSWIQQAIDRAHLADARHVLAVKR